MEFGSCDLFYSWSWLPRVQERLRSRFSCQNCLNDENETSAATSAATPSLLFSYIFRGQVNLLVFLSSGDTQSTGRRYGQDIPIIRVRRRNGSTTTSFHLIRTNCWDCVRYPNRHYYYSDYLIILIVRPQHSIRKFLTLLFLLEI